MKAFITGITGQDGRYLTEYLQSLDYEVIGLARRTTADRKPLDCEVIQGDITDATAIAKIIDRIKPDEIYNLAAQSHVGESFKCPGYTWDVNAKGALNVLEAAKNVGCSFYQASTSELFGLSMAPQNEGTYFHPRSPYAIAKLAAYWATGNAREEAGLHTANGILFNHESPLRGKDFVTQKVCLHAVAVYRGSREKLKLGDLNARRDWGHAKDYVKAMHLALKHGGDYVVATGETHSVKELCETAYRLVGEYWTDWVVTDPILIRPTEVPILKGDSSKIRALGWKPEYTFETTIQDMIDALLTAS